MSAAVDLLATDGPFVADAWATFHSALTERYEHFSAKMGEHLGPADMLHLIGLLLVSVSRNGFRDGATKTRLFEIAQEMGIHVLPVHFYSPVPDTSSLGEQVFSREFTSMYPLLMPDAQLKFLSGLAPAAKEMAGTPTEQRGATEYFWNNQSFGPMDAAVYYSLIRTAQPAHVLEIGSGQSTLVAAKAAVRNGSTALTCVDPYPNEAMRGGIPGLKSLRPTAVQDVPTREFDDLRAGDVLFVDSSHVSKIGSDVNFLILEVLPRLKPGVFVHFHDIFLPYEYPKRWVLDLQLHWNEQYLLLAFLLMNRDVELLSLHHYLGRTRSERLQELFAVCPAVGGGSLWMRTGPRSGH